MKGTFKITLAYLKELGACREGQREFQKAFPDGGEYQEVLDRCAEEGRFDFAVWLFSHVGPTEDVRTYNEDIIEPDKNIFFAGRLEFSGSVSVKRIQAGLGIEAGEGIEAGWGIKAGWGIEAGWGIKAGLGIEAGWGIKAGLGIEAGWGIEAGKGIQAGKGIKAGLGIEAGWGIQAGCGYCVFAGLRVPMSSWESLAVVTAKSKPNNLRSGYWKPLEGSDEKTQ